MRGDWLLGLGAFSTLAVLVGFDLVLALIAHKGKAASVAFRRATRRR